MAGKKVEVEVAAKVSGEQSVDALGDALTETAGAAEKLGTSAGASATGLNKADTAAKGLTGTSGQLSDGVKSVSTQLAEAKNQLLAFMGIQGLAGTVKDVAALADQWANMKSRLQLALGAQTDINAAMGDVEGVAKRTYTSLEATASLYGKIATAGKEMGVSQQQALAVTETINQAIQLSGASAQASEAAVAQLIQGLQSGVVRGDEFNSIMEQAPRLSKAMADGMNVPIGALRGLAEQGKLTSQTVIRALQGQSDAITKEFGSLPVTIGRAVQNLQTEWLKFIGTLDSSTGASSTAAAGIQSIATHLDDLARVATAAGAALTVSFAVQAAQALRAAAVQMAATGGAAALLRKDLDTLSRPVQITIAVTGFEVGYQIGTMLRENYALARQFGAGVVGFFELLVNDLQLLKEAAAAVFTDDTVNAALDRYVERNKTIGATLRDMFADAEKAPGAVGAAVDDAAAKTGALGAAAQTTGAAVAGAGAAAASGISQIGKAGETARDTLEALAAVINQRAPVDNGITDIVRDLTAARLRAQDVDLLLRQQLPEAISKLSGSELAKFRAEFIRAMDEAGIKGKELRTGLGLIAQQAAQSLGVDVPLAFNTLSDGFKSAQGNMAVLIRSLPELKAAGVDTGTTVALALSNMVDSAKSNAELDAVRARIKTLRAEMGDKMADGLLDQLKQKVLELSDALDKAKPGINSLREAMTELGLQSTASLQEAARNASEAFDVIKAKGQEEGESYVAWQNRKADAARVMLERAIAGNRGVADAAITSRAAMEGLEIQTDSTGKSIVKAMGSGADAVKGLGEQFRMTAEQVKANEDAMDRLNMKYTLSANYTERQIALLEKENALVERRNALERERLNIDKEGYSLNTAGQRVNVAVESKASIYQRAKDSGLTDAQALKLSNDTALPYNGPGVKVASPLDDGSNWSTRLQKEIDRLVLINAANSTSTAQAKTYRVVWENNGKSDEFNLSSDAEAQRLVAALKNARLSAS